MKKPVICDSSTLICLSHCCLMHVLDYLAVHADLEFYIPGEVFREAIERPDHMKSHAWSSIKIMQMVNKGTIKVVHRDEKAMEICRDIDRLANNTLFSGSEPIRMVHDGEAHMLALAKRMDLKFMLIDERSTRMLFENPELLREHFEQEFRSRVNISRSNFEELSSMFRDFRFLRSTELTYMAYKKGYFNSFKESKLKAFQYALYALKFQGSSISYSEINSIVHAAKLLG